MKNLTYGLKEVANVVFFEMTTGKPALFFDTLKVSTIENESESVEATGGQGGGNLMSWDFGRKSSLNMQDALLSDKSLSMLSGTEIETENIVAYGRETLTLSSGLTASLKEVPLAKSITVFEYENGVMGKELTASNDEKTLTIVGGEEGDGIIVFYQHNAPVGSTQITFSGNKFPSIYRVVGDTVVRGRDGVDRKMQFVIPQAKLQSGFSLTMDAENVSTFDFNLDVLQEAGTNKLYHIVRMA